MSSSFLEQNIFPCFPFYHYHARTTDADIHGLCGVPGVQFAQEHYTAHETDATATLTLTLSKPSTKPITVLYDTVEFEHSAISYGDYIPQSGSITFAPGETSKPIVVNLVDDKDVEGTVEVGVQVRLVSPDSPPASGGDGGALCVWASQ